PGSTPEQRLEALTTLASLEMSETKTEGRVGPLKAELDAQAKENRTLQKQLEETNTTLETTRNRVVELESQTDALAKERDDFKKAVQDLKSDLLKSCHVNVEAQRNLRTVENQAEDHKLRANRLLVNLETVITKIRKEYGSLSESVLRKLFF